MSGKAALRVRWKSVSGIIVCKKTSEEELSKLISDIRKIVSETTYSISIGYCYSIEPDKNIEEMVKKSDEMMYADKAEHYAKKGLTPR